MNTQAIEYFTHTFEKFDSNIARDLKLNIKRILEGEHLDTEETNLCLLALATSLGYQNLAAVASEQLKVANFTDEQIQETRECASMMEMLNTYYKFRTFLSRHLPPEEMEPYKMARLRMQALARPSLGKDKFEMLAFAVSVLNGCESCVVAHEHALREFGFTQEKIHELARLAATLSALYTLQK